MKGAQWDDLGKMCLGMPYHHHYRDQFSRVGEQTSFNLELICFEKCWILSGDYLHFLYSTYSTDTEQGRELERKSHVEHLSIRS